VKQALTNHPKNWNGHHSKKTSRSYHKNRRIWSLSKKMKLKKIEKREIRHKKDIHRLKYSKNFPKMTRQYAKQMNIKEGDYVNMYIKYKNNNGISRKIVMFDKHGSGHKVEIID